MNCQEGFPAGLTLKISRIPYTQSGTGGSENGTVLKGPQSIMAETAGNKHCRNSILTNTDCMSVWVDGFISVHQFRFLSSFSVQLKMEGS